MIEIGCRINKFWREVEAGSQAIRSVPLIRVLSVSAIASSQS